MPTNPAVRLMLLPKRNKLRLQILRFEQIPRFAQRQRHHIRGGIEIQQGGRPLPDLRRQHIGADRFPEPPGAMISSQSIKLRNCRTLPGQS